MPSPRNSNATSTSDARPPSNATATSDAVRSRRQILAASAGTTLAFAAGCLADAVGNSPTTPDGGPAATNATTDATNSTATTREVTATGTYADAPAGPKSYPDRPGDATMTAAMQFAKEHEYVRTYNSLHEDDVENISVSSSTHYHRAMHDGHYVLATGSGYANYSDGVHADWGQSPALYYVSTALVVRVADFEDYYSDCEDVFASDDPSENFAEVCEGGDASFRAYNLHPDAHDLTVTVDFLGENDTTRILETEYFLGTTGAIQQGSVTYRKGTYRITADSKSGAEATYDWTLQRERDWDDPLLCIVVEPTGALTIRHVPFQHV